jgi:hypothetical protein
MLYVVQLEADGNEWGWRFITPFKGEAMAFAERVAGSEKRVVYISAKDREKTGRSYSDYEATTHVVVEQHNALIHPVAEKRHDQTKRRWPRLGCNQLFACFSQFDLCSGWRASDDDG